MANRSTFRLTGSADASGEVRLTITAPQGTSWLIERMTCFATSAGTPSLYVYDGVEAGENLLDSTTSGALDVADNNSPVYVAAGGTLLFVWEGMLAGERAFVRAQYVAEDATRDQRMRQRYPSNIEHLPYGVDISSVGHKVTAGYGGDGF